MQTYQKKQYNTSRQRDVISKQLQTESLIGNQTMLNILEAQRAQIPAAEQEADRISGLVKGASGPEEVKSELGRELGADFSMVRFHTDAGAAQKADNIGARAYTTGNDIYFDGGGFDPAVAAHELVHTAQQGAVETSVPMVSAPAGGIQMMPKFLKNLFGKKSKEEKQHDRFLKHYKKTDAAYEIYKKSGEKIKGFDERLIPAYARGLDIDQQKDMWGDIKSGEKERMDPHLKRVFTRMLDANTKVNEKTMSEEYSMENVEEAMDMSSDITLTSNFINQNTPKEGMTGRHFNITPEQKKILDKTEALGGNYSTFIKNVHQKNRMDYTANKNNRIMKKDDDFEMYQAFNQKHINSCLDSVYNRNDEGANMFDVAKDARTDFTKSDDYFTGDYYDKPGKKTGLLSTIRGLFRKKDKG
ncbi:MAG: DUF4157 domain-containing protein [Oscillospiraceae bacterium]|jgi:hypothetical protein|nr:DUF4157 domain-containing protein [Oscillospiraceae bacterium]